MVCWLATSGFLRFLFHIPPAHLPREGTAHRRLGSSKSILIKKMSHRLAYRPIWLGHFVSWDFFFSDHPSLCRVDINKYIRFFDFRDRVSLCNHCVDQASLNHGNQPALASLAIELKACATPSSSNLSCSEFSGSTSRYSTYSRPWKHRLGPSTVACGCNFDSWDADAVASLVQGQLELYSET